MEAIRGRHTQLVDGAYLAARVGESREVLVDMGTGDGRYVEQWARRPSGFAIGVDACREHLRDASRRATSNVLYVIANAEQLPAELDGIADLITINFPWGSLLHGLLLGEDAVLRGLCRVARPAARLEVRLNGGALVEAGLSLEEGGSRVARALRGCGLVIGPPTVMDRQALRSCPTSWAKRLAFGRDPRGLLLEGRWPAIGYPVKAPSRGMSAVD